MRPGNISERNYDGRTDGPVHCWFELTYASYLVLPRSVMQHMPIEWQERFVRCLNEMSAATETLPGYHGLTYAVNVRGPGGKFVKDDFAQYRREIRPIPDLEIKS